jgi:ABC-type phosphate transport system substrate-binding protein
MIRSMEGFSFDSALDSNMGYNHIKLDADAQKLSTIVPHGENTNTNAYPWVSRLPQMFSKYHV